MYVLTSLRTCVESQSKVDAFFLTFYGSIYIKYYRKDKLTADINCKLILWALRALLFLLVFINCLLLESGFGVLSNRDGYFTAIGIVFILPAFVLYTILAVGMFTGKNVCTVIAKSYGLLLLIMDILIIIFAFIGIKLVLSKIFRLNLFQMISNMLASAREAAGKVDKAALGQYAQAAKAAGKTLSDSELLNQLALAGNVAAAQATPRPKRRGTNPSYE